MGFAANWIAFTDYNDHDVIHNFTLFLSSFHMSLEYFTTFTLLVYLFNYALIQLTLELLAILFDQV